MNRFKLLAYKQEFPFLEEIIGDSNPDSVRIKRADENLLRVTPRYYYHNGSMGETEDNEKIHFVLKDGTLIKNAVEQSGHTSSNYAHSQTKEWKGQTVLEAIDQHGVADKLEYIVVEQYYLDDWEGSDYEKEYSCIVYKTPKGASFGEKIEKARACALAEVRAEADF